MHGRAENGVKGDLAGNRAHRAAVAGLLEALHHRVDDGQLTGEARLVHVVEAPQQHVPSALLGDIVQRQLRHLHGGGVEVDHLGHVDEKDAAAVPFDAQMHAPLPAVQRNGIRVQSRRGQFGRCKPHPCQFPA